MNMNLISPNKQPMSFLRNGTASKNKRVIKLLLAVIIFALGIGLSATGYLYYQTKQKLDWLSTPQGQQRLSEQEVAAVVEKLRKLTLLPDEQPVVATIIDADFLATQSAFYNQSQNGDKVVIFPQAERAYIYSPDRNIIVNSGPLITQQPNQYEVEVRNGSQVAGLAEQVSNELKAQGASVVAVGNAANKDYTSTQVIGVSADVPSSVLQAIATYLSGSVVTNKPAAEAGSSADILIIVGSGDTTDGANDAIVSSPTPMPSSVDE